MEVQLHPNSASEFVWDEGNARELSRHKVTPSEVEEVFSAGASWLPNKKNRSGNWKMIGYTNGGRVLTLILFWDEEKRSLRAITGWDSTKSERTRYLI